MTESVRHEFTVPPESSGNRLDRFLAAQAQDLSRSRLKALILEGTLKVNGHVCGDPSLKLKGGERIVLDVPPPVDDTPKAQKIALDIVYEDEALIVLNKPPGLVVHAGAGHHDGTLVNALLHHCGDTLSGIGGVKRPGIVHRLDKDTSGLMLVAKSDRAHQGLSAQLADRTLSRTYKALVWDIPSPPKGRVEAAIGRHSGNRQKMAVVRSGGREAATRFRVEESFGVASLVECQLETGRTHQVRVHMTHICPPLIGDPLYGLPLTGVRSRLARTSLTDAQKKAVEAFPRQALHAAAIGFIHPLTDEEMGFQAEIPKDMKKIISYLKSNT